MIEDSDSEPRRLPREEDGRRSRRRRALEHRSQPHFNRSRCQCPESETHRSGQRIGHVILAKVMALVTVWADRVRIVT